MMKRNGNHVETHNFMDIKVDNVCLYETVGLFLNDLVQDDIHRLCYLDQGHTILSLENHDYPVIPGCVFYIHPASSFRFEGIGAEPIRLINIHFTGSSALSIMQWVGLFPDHPVFKLNQNTYITAMFNQIINFKHISLGRELGMTGILYQILSYLIEQSIEVTNENDTYKINKYVKFAVSFIETHYTENDLSVTEISNYVGLNSNYLCTIFREEMNVTLKEYLIHFRLRQACTLLKQTKLPIGSIAYSVGYDDPLLFSKMFRKYRNIPPSEYRKIG